MSESRSRTILHTVMDLAEEDAYGLWEVALKVGGNLDEAVDDELISDVRSAILDLIRERKLELYWSEASNLRVVNPDDVATEFTDAKYWTVAAASVPHLEVYATDEGRRAFQRGDYSADT